MAKVEFLFDFGSPNAYLCHRVIPGIEARTGDGALTWLNEGEAALNSIGHLVDAAEVAWVVAFLCSPKSRAINGDAVCVGGGAPRARRP